jgi:co-chaperonin GroES (HSP10)
MELDLSKVKMLRKDIFIKKCEDDYTKVKSSLIHIEDKNGNNDINYYDVVNVGSKVIDVKVGDVILVKFGNHMTPVVIDGVKYSLTDEEHVEGVLEK